MISIYDTIVIPLIVCLCVSVFLAGVYNEYWKNHKISIFGTMGAATFVWVTYMNNLLLTMTIFVFAIVMVMVISICDALGALKMKKNEESAEMKSHKEEV